MISTARTKKLTGLTHICDRRINECLLYPAMLQILDGNDFRLEKKLCWRQTKRLKKKKVIQQIVFPITHQRPSVRSRPQQGAPIVFQAILGQSFEIVSRDSPVRLEKCDFLYTI